MFQFILAAGLLTAGAEPATYPIGLTGKVCIEHSSFEAGEVLALVAEKTTEGLKPICPDDGNHTLQGLHIEISDPGHGCPFGHEFAYSLTGKCFQEF